MQHSFKPLYGLSSKNAVKFWKIYVQIHPEGAEIVTEHGQFGGKIQTARETIRSGKNIGKANETTPFDQACLEAESKWKKQHDKNYNEYHPEESSAGKCNVVSPPSTKLLPMLAQKFVERKKNLVWPAFAQPKLNGVRCLVQRVGGKIIYWSRKAKKYKNFNLYMDQEFLSFMKDGDILDGEMYNHGDLTFQQLVSLIKDEKTPDLESLKKYVKFWNYDRPDGDKGFRERFVEHPSLGGRAFQYIRTVQTLVVKNEDEVKTQQTYYVQDGYEGTIVRSGGDESYRFQYRDNQLQKYKDFIDEEFVIVGCKEGTGKDEGKAIFRCTTKYGKEFDVRCKGSDDVRREQWMNRKSYLHKELTVRYQTLSDDEIPIFPVGITVRDYE